MDRNPDPLDATQATSPESRQGERTPVDLPPPAVQGHGIRTGESIDPGAARSAAAGFGAASASDGRLPAASDEDLLGTVYVGKYELVSIIGSGGMGVIYQGRQVFLDRIVAIKMLKSNLGGERARMRFHQEAKASSQLIHPGIVSIIDFGVDELDRPYMVMEYVEGCTFSDLLRERQYLSVKDSLPIFLEICDALSIAHHKGVVHRDLKPSNIMLVVGADDKVHIKLLDFGIAKLLDTQEQTLQSMTKTGEALGTPLYMSPEQILGNKVTSRSDLYSLGCMMYACLTGSPPFVGANKLATMEKHCTAKPLPLKQASNGRDFAPGMEEIVLQLLEKKPDDRFENVDQLRDALIAMAVQNRLMRSSASNDVAAGQLYMTGAIPEMPKSITSLLTTSNTSGMFSSPPPVARLDRASSVHTEGTSNLSRSQRDLPYGFNETKKDSGILGSLLDSHVKKIAGTAAILGFFLIFVVGIFVGQLKQKNPTPEPLKKSPAAKITSLEYDSPNRLPREIPDDTADQFITVTLSAGGMNSSLTLRGLRGLSNIGIHKLTEFKGLLNLDLGDTELSDAMVAKITSIPLRLLILDDNAHVSDLSLLNLSRMPGLEQLSLAHTRISNDGLRYLAASKSITSIFLGNNMQLTDQAIRNLGPKTSHLVNIFLNGCGITDASALEYLKFKDLKGLNLQGTHISDETIQILQSRANDFVYLSVANDRISSKGIQALKKFHNLVALDLSGVKLDSISCRDLATLTNLQAIYLVDCGLSLNDLQYLKKKFPNAKIESIRRRENCLDCYAQVN